MGIEIERKYLVNGDSWRELGDPVHYIQGYLQDNEDKVVRIRIQGEKAYLTIKGRTKGLSRKEFEYPMPHEDATEMLFLCGGLIVEKKRSTIKFQGKIWEVDEFEGKNKGLILAEIELESEDESFSIPPWIGKEVSGDPRYYNSYLARHPFMEGTMEKSDEHSSQSR